MANNNAQASNAKSKSKSYEMLTRVKHNGTLFEMGSRVTLSPEDAKTFAQKGFIDPKSASAVTDEDTAPGSDSTTQDAANTPKDGNDKPGNDNNANGAAQAKADGKPEAK